MYQLIDSVHFISLIVFIAAFITLLIFWYNLRHEKYWIGFPTTLAFFTLHEIFEILHDNYGYATEILAEFSEIIGAIVLTITVYLLIRELRKINFLESDDSDLTE